MNQILATIKCPADEAVSYTHLDVYKRQADGRAYIRNYPFLITFPGLAIALTVLALNLLGDGLRDALDPKLRD